jgi:hypothetical protein
LLPGGASAPEAKAGRLAYVGEPSRLASGGASAPEGKAGRLTYVGEPSRLAPGGASALEGKAGRLTYSRGRRFGVEDAHGAALNDKRDQPLEQHEEPIGETDQEVNMHARPEEPGH